MLNYFSIAHEAGNSHVWQKGQVSVVLAWPVSFVMIIYN